MDLNDYPRPANDTGIGIHWSAGQAAAVGMGKIRDFWIPELRAMGVKWVKIFNHDGALEFCELLLAEGFFPIVRLYRPAPNPGLLGVKERVHLDTLIRVGVRYFEFNNEPDVDVEWKGGRVPINGVELTVENTIATAEVILERGGMPAIPALSNGSQWDLVGRIVAAGRRDLLDGPVWQAVHNYPRNRPLDYPYDSGNQEGGAFTERFYRAVANEPWSSDGWRGRTLEEVNRLRYDRRSPGAAVADDPACWLAYEHFDALNRKHLGHSLPVLATESGYLVGEDSDPRYPATTPDLHMAQTLEACRVMMGVSQRFKVAPDYFFCAAFWLVANERLGSASSWWEEHAWYSDRWPGGQLPIVRALQAEPKKARALAGNASAILLRGSVANVRGAAQLCLLRAGHRVAEVALDSTGVFEFADLAEGLYVLQIPDAHYSEEVLLQQGQREVVVRLSLPLPPAAAGRSSVEGHVAGGAGAGVLLVHKQSGEEWVTLVREDGSYRFVGLAAGDYSLRVEPAGTELETLKLNGRDPATVDLRLAGWGYTVRPAETTAGIGAVVVSVPRHPGLRVVVHGTEGVVAEGISGTAPDEGAAACRITGLEEGYYLVTVEGAPQPDGRAVELEARVRIDKRTIPLVEFVFGVVSAAAPAAESTIGGSVRGGAPGQPRRVVLWGDAGRREQEVGEEGRYRFEGLEAGRYTVQVAGHEETTTVADVALDGRNQVAVDLLLPESPRAEEGPPPPGQGLLAVSVPEGAGRQVRLVDAVGNEQRLQLDESGRATFSGLAAGVYGLYAEGGYEQPQIEIDGVGGWSVQFAPLASLWEATATEAGSMPGFSALQVEIEGKPNHPVRVYQGEEEEYTLPTRSRAEQGMYGVEFKPLGAGLYRIMPDDLGVWTTVSLTGLNLVRVSFQRRLRPVAPTQLEPLARGGEPSGLPYLYLAEVPASLEILYALLELAGAVPLQVGRDLEAAARASQVWLVESPQAADAELWLRRRGVPVQRLSTAEAIRKGAA